MNKALHVFVYLFLALACAGLWFEMQLNAKRKLLTDRNRLQENYIVKIARTVEKDDAPKDVEMKIEKDVSPVEAKLVDMPDMENVLEEYKPYLETANLETFDWDNTNDRGQLRNVYVLDEEGKPIMDGDRPLMSGQGTEDEILNRLFEASGKQQSRLNTTRAELGKLRGILEETVEELNKLKPVARQDKVTIIERNEKIAKLESEKADLENQVVKKNNQIDELNGEITSLRDEVQTAKDEAAVKAEELEKSEERVKNLTKMLQEQLHQTGTNAGKGTIASIPVGDKGKIIHVDNENMFAIISLSDSAMKQLKGNDMNGPIPLLEFGVKRDGKFVGRIRLRQEVPGKNYIVCDVLANWKQDNLRPDDVVFAD